MKLVILLLICNVNAFSQSILKGIVIDAVSNNPIPNANVFITNTSIGTATNQDGTFILNNVPNGLNEIIISCIGYSTQSKTFNSKDLPNTLTIVLKVKQIESEAVTVRSPVKNGWEKWGQTFLDSYLGTSENSTHCKLKNPKAIKFYYDKKTNQLEVVADEILEIENKKLGYLIKHQLEYFLLDFKNSAVYNLGYPYFTEIDTKRKRKQNNYEKERQRAYNGSLMHLFRSLYTDSAHVEGFTINDIKRVYNTERQRVETIVKKTRLKNMQLGQRIVISSNINVLDSTTFGDSTAYYNKILNEQPYYDVLGAAYTAKDLIIKDSTIDDDYYLTFPNELYIQYKPEPQEEAYFKYTVLGKREKFQTTRISFTEITKRYIHISRNGNYLQALDILLDGYMGWEKMADMLPLNYIETNR